MSTLPINISIFELLKIGPGPSSSHTIGPMKAGYDFYNLINNLPDEQKNKATSIKIYLYGSLAATGKGHGTDRAVIAGLLGKEPETCPSEFLDSIALTEKKGIVLSMANKNIKLSLSDIILDTGQHDFPYSNTMILELKSNKDVLLQKEYYSVGGGFIQYKGMVEEKRGTPMYPYSNTVELKKQLKKYRLRLHELILKNETSITGMTSEEINERLDRIIDVMQDAVKRGLKTEGYLPGPIGLHRKAPLKYQRSRTL